MDLEKYNNFVGKVTSKESTEYNTFINRVEELNKLELANIPLLITAVAGLTAEAGEFAELPKKILFQGKPLDDASIYHMKRELVDVIFYWINACRALNVSPDKIIKMNVEKLTERYPDGKFDAFFSENRKTGDI